MACYRHLVAVRSQVGQGQASVRSSPRVFGKQWGMATGITRHPGKVRLVLPHPLPALALPQLPHLCGGKQVGVEGNPV